MQDLQTTLSAADALVELRPAAGQSGDDRVSKEGKVERNGGRSFRPRQKERGKAVPRAEPGNSQGSDVRPMQRFACRRPHRIRECPNNPKGKMAAVQAEESSDSGELVRMSTLQTLGALRVEQPKQGGLGLRSVPADLN